MIRRSRLTLAFGLAVLGVAVSVAPAHGQSLPLPPAPLPGVPGLADLLANPGHWVSDVFNAALLALGKQTTDQLTGMLNGLFSGEDNFLFQTSPRLSYESDAVHRLWELLRTGANGGLGVVTAWSAINMIVHPHIRAPYHGALELVPRVLVGGVLVNTSLTWGGLAIRANNALCADLGAAHLPGWDAALSDPGGLLVNLIALVIYLIMSTLLFGQMLMRLALVDVLLIISPIALLCWVVPQTYSWARLWCTTFIGTVFVQSLQVAVLHLGSDLIGNLVGLLPSVGADPIGGGQHWLISLLLGLAVLQLARKVPRLMPGYPGGVANVPSQLSILQTRNLASLFIGQRSDNRGGRRQS